MRTICIAATSLTTAATGTVPPTGERQRTDTARRRGAGNMTAVKTRELDATAVHEAAAAIAPHIRRTPTEKSDALSGLAGRDVYLKLENLQKTGSFKIRGALNALMRMGEDRRANGVITASAGNHGQGVAFAAKLLGVPACVVLAVGGPLPEVAAVLRVRAVAGPIGRAAPDARAAAGG